MTQQDRTWLYEQLNSWKEIADQFRIGTGVSFSDLVNLLLSGDVISCLKLILSGVKNILEESVRGQRSLLVWLIMIGMISMLLHILTKAFERGKGNELILYFFMLLIGTVMLKEFQKCYTIAENTLEEVTTFTSLLGPSYLISVSLADGLESGIGSRLVLVFVIQILEKVYLKLLLPFTKGYLLLFFMNTIWQGNRLEGLLDLIRKILDLLLKASLGFVTGSGFFQTVLARSLGGTQNSVLASAASMFPGVGDISEGIINITLNSAGVIKNTLGILLIILILFLCMAPLLFLLSYTWVLRVAGAYMGIIGNQKLVGFLNKMGEILGWLCKITGMGVLLFVISIALTCGIGNK